MKYELRSMIFIAVSIILASLFIIHPVFAAPPTPCKDSAEFGPCPAGLTEIEAVIGNVISVVVGLGFIALLILVLWSGFKFITSGGEPKTLQAARQTFAFAILGVLFMALAWLILLLIKNFTGLDVTAFNIKTLCNVGGVDICKP